MDCSPVFLYLHAGKVFCNTGNNSAFLPSDEVKGSGWAPPQPAHYAHKGDITMKTFNRMLSLIMTLILFACLLPTPASAAASYSKSTLNTIRDKWNATTWSKSNAVSNTYKYEGAYQCAAFSRYVFMQLYGHADTLNNANNKVTIKKFTTTASLLDFLKTTAAPGDAIRITNLRTATPTSCTCTISTPPAR